MQFVLGFVFFLFLMLLALIFGEKLSVVGRLHGRWLGRKPRRIKQSLTTWYPALPHSVQIQAGNANDGQQGLAGLWYLLCSEVDRAWCFLVAHLWWVLAVSSGTAGVVIVAWIIFGGLTDHARAEMVSTIRFLDAGGLLDHTPVIDSRLEPRPESSGDGRVVLPTVYQVPSPGRRAVPVNRGIQRNDSASRREPADNEELTFSEFPPLPQLASPDDSLHHRNRWEWPGESSDTAPDLRLSMQPVDHESASYEDESVSESEGHLVSARQVSERINEALRYLSRQRSRWKRRAPVYDFSSTDSEFEGNGRAIREDTAADVRAMEHDVKVVPGSVVGSSDLQIDKLVSRQSTGEEFDVQIGVTASGQHRMSGLIVREFLPQAWEPVAVGSDGLYRDGIVTWLLNDLRPRERRVLTLTVRSRSPGRYPSRTEVSALAAVVAKTDTHSNRTNNRAPGVPDVQIRVGPLPDWVTVNEQIDVIFQLRNVGTATARLVTLRTVLPKDLDHFRLAPTDSNREIWVRKQNLAPSASKEVLLRIHADEPGTHKITVELLVDGRWIDDRTFSVNVREDRVRSSDFPPNPF